ncbi:MAG: PleD family two-component system response regulator [bacterium]
MMNKQAKILIIEDDVDLVEAMKVTLGAKNYEVIAAYDGKEGLKKAKGETPNLIILDVIMRSETEGFNVSYDLRKDPELCYIPILMVTAIAEKTGFSFSPDTDGEFLPVDDYVEKPVRHDDLLKRVEKLLKLKKEEINIRGRKSIL